MSKLILLVISVTALLVNCGSLQSRAKRHIQCIFTKQAVSACSIPLANAALKIDANNCEAILTDTLKSCLPQYSCKVDLDCALGCVTSEVCEAPISFAANPGGALNEALNNGDSCFVPCGVI